MAMVAGLTGLGFGAKELFKYNRENFKFDQKQRLEREALRLEMQVKRFELFREDVRDLVELTVGRMDVYHLVGALFLHFCIILFCRGRVQASAPPFVISLFMLSNACAFIYLLMAVWLSMHASIASHSFGVRLLTRFVRLPIPSIQQIMSLRSQLKDYEQQGVENLLRLPFLQSQQKWESLHAGKNADRPDARTGAMGRFNSVATASTTDDTPIRPSSSKDKIAAPHVSGVSEARPLQPQNPRGMLEVTTSRIERIKSPSQTKSGPDSVQASATGSGSSVAQNQRQPSFHPPFQQDNILLPESDLQMLVGGDDLLSGARGAAPDRHVQLFRQLQTKWQCYDAYCRVCMGLGVNQILQALSYFGISHTLVEHHSTSTGIAMVVLFQSTTVALALLDLAGLKRKEILAVQLVGMVPCFLTAWGVAQSERNEGGVLHPDQDYYLSPLSFLFQALWLELWLFVAQPSTDSASLPRRFRQVLFLDVFGDAIDWDPMKADGVDAQISLLDDPEESLDADAATEQVAAQLVLAQQAMRRWAAVPEWALSRPQHQELGGLKSQLASWRSAVQTELARQSATEVSLDASQYTFDEDLRSWSELSEIEKASDPFADMLLGPFEHDDGYRTSRYYYSLERHASVFEEDRKKTTTAHSGETDILTLEALSSILSGLETRARQLIESRIVREMRVATIRLESENAPPVGIIQQPLQRPSRAIAGNFPNIINMMKKRYWQKRRNHADREVRVGLLTAQPLPPTLSQEDASAPHSARARRDPTLVAMAGENAQHFVPERLPWQMVSRVSRVLQFCWLMAGLMIFLKETDIYEVDFQQSPLRQRRRLCSLESGSLEFGEVEVDWPHGALFRPHALLCPFASEGQEFVIGSPFALYSRLPSSSWPLTFLEAHRLRVPAGVSAACPQSNSSASGVTPSVAHGGLSSCLLIAPVWGGLAVWGPGGQQGPSGTVRLLLEEKLPWKQVAATTLPCDTVSKLVPPREAESLHASLDAPVLLCLLLAGYDGEGLYVAATRLPRGPSSPPHGDTLLTPVLVDRTQQISALHIEPASGLLWALLAKGQVNAWDVSKSRTVGHWRPSWPSSIGTPFTKSSSSFQAVAMCVQGSGALLVLGRAPARGPLLLRARLPSSLSEYRMQHGFGPAAL